MVITGCGHSGIINILKYAKELTGEDRIYAVIGGMHLTGGIFEPIIPRTIDELQRLKPRFLIPCHCSGLKAVNEIVRKMSSDPDYDPDIYTDPDAEYDPTYDGDPSNSLEEGWDSEPERSERRIQTTVWPTRQFESFRTQKGWDPDNEQSAQTMILKTIIAEREKRAAEVLEIQRQRQELEVEKRNIAQLNV